MGKERTIKEKKMQNKFLKKAYFIIFKVTGTLTQNSEVPLNCTAHCLTRNLQVQVEVDDQFQVRVRIKVNITRNKNKKSEKNMKKKKMNVNKYIIRYNKKLRSIRITLKEFIITM